MNPLLAVALGIQTFFASSAVVLNLLLLFVISKYTTRNIGFYKYILMSFAIFEIVFAIGVLLGEPIFFISQKTLIAFTYYGPLAKTPYSFLGPTTYCFFYLIWLGLVVVHFIFRYITVCRGELRDYISYNTLPKSIIWFLVFLYTVWSFFCVYFFCPSNKPHKELMQKIYKDFEIENNTEVANYVMRFTDINGNFHLLSTIAVLAHYVIITVSGLAVFYCGWGLWSVIRGVKREAGMNFSLEKQLFKSLLLQTVVPVSFSHAPSLFAMFFPIIEFDVGIFSFFSVFTTVPKALDPLILFFCLRCYRRGLRKLFCNRRGKVSAADESSRAVVYISRVNKDFRTQNPTAEQ